MVSYLPELLILICIVEYCVKVVWFGLVEETFVPSEEFDNELIISRNIVVEDMEEIFNLVDEISLRTEKFT